jgi:GNAT superfamily N-acetyltransferase
MWPDQPFDFVKVPNDNDGHHFGLFVEDNLITVVSAFITGDAVQFRKLATEAGQQGKGYGSAILSYVIDWARQKEFQSIWCNARANKTCFYRNFGMIETDQTYQKGGLDFVVMEMTL